MPDTKNIFKKIILIMQDVDPVKKDRKNSMQNYQFRGIDDVYNELHPAFAKHGVFISSKVIERVREERQTKNGGLLIYSILTVEFTFFADDGSSFSSITVGEGMDSGDKSCNKAMSAALKYALMQLLLIPTAEKKDSENDTPKPTAARPPRSSKFPPPKKALSDKNFIVVLARIEKGEKELIEKTEAAFELTKEQKHELNNLKTVKNN